MSEGTVMQNKFRVSGAFFESTKDSGPAFTGFVEIDGVKTYVSLWPKTSKAGNNYFQVSEDKKKMAPASGGPQTGSPLRKRAPSAPQDNSDMDDDIPF